jgi:hypothetical protein
MLADCRRHIHLVKVVLVKLLDFVVEAEHSVVLVFVFLGLLDQ